ncbi:universal stress protein [Sulfurimonas sp.]|uniref:universal stress protein n=1 Tax=Sulfurimonas sp. TaxID=2022749 RepID=UPI003564EE50
MKVVASLNGSITSESMAFYALKYAQAQDFTLVLFHVENRKDDIEDVKASIERISTIAVSENIKVETVILSKFSKKNIKNYLLDINADTIFCSTRKHTKFIKNSFSELLIKMNLNIDIAVVRIVHINNILESGNIFLSIKEDKLSVKKFTFFSILSSAYKAKGEIYSVTKISKFRLAAIGIHETRERLSAINYNLRHYKKLSNFMPFSLNIKHDFTFNETQSILSQVAKSDVDLLIIGARRLSVRTLFSKELPIERLMREASVNTIAYYTKE